jgi:hypothetical protein
MQDDHPNVFERTDATIKYFRSVSPSALLATAAHAATTDAAVLCSFNIYKFFSTDLRWVAVVACQGGHRQTPQTAHLIRACAMCSTAAAMQKFFGPVLSWIEQVTWRRCPALSLSTGSIGARRLGGSCIVACFCACTCLCVYVRFCHAAIGKRQLRFSPLPCRHAVLSPPTHTHTQNASGFEHSCVKRTPACMRTRTLALHVGMRYGGLGTQQEAQTKKHGDRSALAHTAA